jgi:tRNA A-37 threonylcarbamoyl transferase component Bud32
MDLLRTESQKYLSGWGQQLSEVSRAAIVNSIENDRPAPMPALEGRLGVRRLNCDDIGPVVIKEYRRGGLIGRLLGNFHLRLGKGRAELEVEYLNLALSNQVNVPAPIGFVETQGTIYKAWSVLREIPGAVSLAEMARQDSSKVDLILDKAAVEIVKLIKARIFHIDLHPGNVLIGDTGEVFLIDFDKASKFKGELKDLRDMYLCRWRRAVIKHNLPHFLGERMSLNLRQNNVWDERRTA